MSTVERPVTQMAETAVKSASESGVADPDREDTGNASRAVHTRISAVKISSAVRAGEDWIVSRNHPR